MIRQEACDARNNKRQTIYESEIIIFFALKPHSGAVGKKSEKNINKIG